MKPVAAYVRMSTDHQRYSIANQLAAIDAFCRDAALSLTKVYVDDGKSGLTLAGRPGLQALLREAQAGSLPFEAVVVLDVSRWGRFQNVDEGAWLEQTMKRAGAPVLYCGEAFDNDASPTSAMIKAVKRAMAAEYSRELSHRVATGARRIAAEGWRPGAIAGYGYRRVVVSETGEVLQRTEAGQRKALHRGRTTLVLGPPAEVAAVRRLFHLYVRRRLTCRRIAELMVAEGWPPPAPRSFCKTWVRCVLGNEKYAGHLVYGKTRSPLATRIIRVDRADWTVARDSHPPIVAERLFRAAQARLARSRRPYTRDEVVRGLRRLHARHGMVSSALIRDSALLPPVDQVQRLFGGLAAAYAAAGLPPMPLGVKRALSKQRNARRRARRRTAAPPPP